jgi:hypothetical protein
MACDDGGQPAGTYLGIEGDYFDNARPHFTGIESEPLNTHGFMPRHCRCAERSPRASRWS